MVSFPWHYMVGSFVLLRAQNKDINLMMVCAVSVLYTSLEMNWELSIAFGSVDMHHPVTFGC